MTIQTPLFLPENNEEEEGDQKPIEVYGTTVNPDGSVFFKDFLVSVELIGPEMAEVYLECNSGNRTLRPTVVKEYAAEMSKGNWRLIPDGIAFDEKENVLNGQHRLSSVMNSGTTQPFFVFRKCNKDLFHIIDVGRKRSVADIVQMSDKARHRYYKNAVSLSRYVMCGLKGESASSVKRNSISPIDIGIFYKENRSIIEDYVKRFKIIPLHSVRNSAWMGAFVLAGILFGRERVDSLVDRFSEFNWSSSEDPMKALYTFLTIVKTKRVHPDAEYNTHFGHSYVASCIAIRSGVNNSHLKRIVILTGKDYDFPEAKALRKAKGWIKDQ